MSEIVITVVIVALLGFCGAFLDSSLGMGYGLLSPILIGLGLNPLVVVPVLLISQMTTGFSATICHSIYKNVDLESSKTRDFRATVLFVFLGALGMMGAISLAFNLPERFVMLYISIVITFAGILMFPKIKFKFSWKRMYILSGIAAFNKAISGGGYGPVMTIGQMASGRDARQSVAVTDFSEAFLSGFGFFLYSILNDFGTLIAIINLSIIMIASGLIATPLGALLTKILDEKKAKKIIGALSVTIGVITLTRVIFNWV